MSEAAAEARPALGLGIRRGAWRGDQPFYLPVPSNWETVILWPATPPPLDAGQIAECLERPTGQPPIRELCKGKSRPLVIVDDLNRPTPASAILPALLRQFQQAGVSPGKVRILVSTGTHGSPDRESVMQKIGEEAARSCQVLVHDCKRDAVRAGITSSGLRVDVNPDVLSSDFVVGIGGIYPNQTAGFGGGSKLLLGVLGFQTIRGLHFRNSSMGWGVPDSGEKACIRRDLDEIAAMLRLETSIAVHIDANRNAVRVACGEPLSVMRAETAFALATFTVAGPGEADVVISNAYPSDISLTTAWQKGLAPLARCAPGVSRVMIASCPDGVGRHGLFPISNHPGLFRLKFIAARVANMSPRQLAAKILRRRPKTSLKRNPVWLYRPGDEQSAFSVTPPGVHVTRSWDAVVEAIAEEQCGKRTLRVAVYPCAPLQILSETGVRFVGGKA